MSLVIDKKMKNIMSLQVEVSKQNLIGWTHDGNGCLVEARCAEYKYGLHPQLIKKPPL